MDTRAIVPIVPLANAIRLGQHRQLASLQNDMDNLGTISSVTQNRRTLPRNIPPAAAIQRMRYFYHFCRFTTQCCEKAGKLLTKRV